MSGQVALQATNLSKRFGNLQAVKDLSLSVNAGDIFGFLGPNGAGKTTSIRMMLGLIEASSGSASIFGHDIRREFKQAVNCVGAMVEGPASYPYMTGRQNLRLFGRLSGGISEERINEILQMVGLSRRGDDKVKGYSQGMRQRLGIAMALSNRPRLLVLDEPTNGLDPQGMREVRNLIRRVRDEEGTTVLVSSHLLGEMEMVCDRIAVVFRGEIVKEGRMDELIGSGSDMIAVGVEADDDQKALALTREKFERGAELTRRGWIEMPRAGHDLYLINKTLMDAGVRVSSLATRRRTLEEYFVELTGESQDVY